MIYTHHTEDIRETEMIKDPEVMIAETSIIERNKDMAGIGINQNIHTLNRVIVNKRSIGNDRTVQEVLIRDGPNIMKAVHVDTQTNIGDQEVEVQEDTDLAIMTLVDTEVTKSIVVLEVKVVREVQYINLHVMMNIIGSKLTKLQVTNNINPIDTIITGSIGIEVGLEI